MRASLFGMRVADMSPSLSSSDEMVLRRNSYSSAVLISPCAWARVGLGIAGILSHALTYFGRLEAIRDVAPCSRCGEHHSSHLPIDVDKGSS